MFPIRAFCALLFSGLQAATAAPYLSKTDAFSTVVVPPEFVVVEGYSPTAYASEPELTFEELASWIREGKAKTIPELIALLPHSMRDINYILMYRSRSLQFASPEAPRVISFSPTARLMLSFNGGDVGKRGANAVELIQFRDDSKRFEFREIEFPQGEAPRISEANPKKCITCHQAESRVGLDLRPNWEPYNVWPGAYGSFDALVGRNDKDVRKVLKERSDSPADFKLALEAAKEPAGLQKFLRLAGAHPRYQQLEGLNTQAVLTLSDLLSILNLQRVARLMREETALYQKMEPVWNWFAFCDAKRGVKFDEAHPELQNFLADRPIYYPRPGWDAPMLYPGEGLILPDRLSALSFVVKYYESFGIDTSDWSMDFATGGRFGAINRFSTTTNSDGIFGQALKKAILAGGLELSCGTESEKAGHRAKADAHITSFLTNPEILAQRKLPSFRTDEKQTLSSLLKKCLSCHDGTDFRAPEISFGEPELLKRDLAKKTKSGRRLVEEIRYRIGDLVSMEEQMPPGKKLDPAEGKALRAFLRSLEDSKK